MTIDTLLSDFDAAVMRAQAANREDLPAWAHRRAGLVAVVKALRDELNRVDWDLHESAIEVLVGILGSDAGEKVAGGPSSNEDTVTAPRRAAPAADLIKEMQRMGQEWDAAPAVCEWTQGKDGWLVTACRAQYGLSPFYYKPKGCCEFCGRNIKFTEGKT